MLSLRKDAAYQSIRKAMDQADLDFKDPLKRRRDLIDKVTGDNWRNDGAKRETLYNFLWSAVETYHHRLMIARPRAAITSRVQQHSWFADHFQVTVNDYAKEINMDEELSMMLLDSFFGYAIAHVCWEPSEQRMSFENPNLPIEPSEWSAPEEWQAYQMAQEQMPGLIDVDPGRASIKRISPDDFTYDLGVSRWKDIRWAQCKYRVALDEAQQDQRFPQEWRDKLEATSKYGDTRQDRAEMLSKNGWSKDYDELEPMVTLREVWVPGAHEWGIVSEQQDLGPGYVGDDRKGPPGGPFRLLQFGSVPDNIEPISLLGNLDNLHDLLNALWRKASRQAQRQKSVTTFTNESDAEEHRKASDGQMVKQTGAPGNKVDHGGVFGPNVAFAMQVEKMLNAAGGNIALLAGLGPQSDTAKQDALLKGSSSELEVKRIQRLADFVGELYEALGWMLWHDPVHEHTGTYYHPDLDTVLQAKWSPERRLGEWLDYQFTFEPYSEAYQSPMAQADALEAFLQRTIMPLMPVFQQEGMSLSGRKIIDTFARLRNQPYLRDIWRDDPAMRQMALQGGGGQQDGAPKPGGPKEYVHTNRTPDPVNRGGDDSMMAMLSAQQGAQSA